MCRLCVGIIGFSFQWSLLQRDCPWWVFRTIQYWTWTLPLKFLLFLIWVFPQESALEFRVVSEWLFGHGLIFDQNLWECFWFGNWWRYSWCVVRFSWAFFVVSVWFWRPLFFIILCSFSFFFESDSPGTPAQLPPFCSLFTKWIRRWRALSFLFESRDTCSSLWIRSTRLHRYIVQWGCLWLTWRVVVRV